VVVSVCFVGWIFLFFGAFSDCLQSVIFLLVRGFATPFFSGLFPSYPPDQPRIVSVALIY
jgi:hypothetical protein